MTQTHISYQTAKALKEFCPELPEPIVPQWYFTYECNKDSINMGTIVSEKRKLNGAVNYPRYMLHDLLSRPFCEAVVRELFASGLNRQAAAWEVINYVEKIVNAYYNGGLPAVEAELCRMIKGDK